MVGSVVGPPRCGTIVCPPRYLDFRPPAPAVTCALNEREGALQLLKRMMEEVLSRMARYEVHEVARGRMERAEVMMRKALVEREAAHPERSKTIQVSCRG